MRQWASAGSPAAERWSARARLGLWQLSARDRQGILPFTDRPASGYAYGCGEPLRVAVIEEARGTWWAAIHEAVARYGAATRHLQFQWVTPAHIVVMAHRYTDAAPPSVPGRPRLSNCWAVTCRSHRAGEIVAADVYLNDACNPKRRVDLVLHELGHAIGLERHSADLGIAQLVKRYGWKP